VPARTLPPKGATSVGGENETSFIRVRKPLPRRCVLKILRKNPKRTISASGGLEPLHKVEEDSVYGIWAKS